MDSNEFTQNFWNLSEKNAPEVIVKSAESIVELLESKQKASKHNEIKNKQKYRVFLHVFQNSTEDLVYTLSRLVNKIILLIYFCALLCKSFSKNKFMFYFFYIFICEKNYSKYYYQKSF